MTQSTPPDTFQDEAGTCVTFFDAKRMSGEEIDDLLGAIFGHNSPHPPSAPTKPNDET